MPLEGLGFKGLGFSDLTFRVYLDFPKTHTYARAILIEMWEVRVGFTGSALSGLGRRVGLGEFLVWSSTLWLHDI